MVKGPKHAIKKVLDGFLLLDISGMCLPHEVQIINIDGKGFTDVVENDLSYFSALKYLNASENNLNMSCLTSLSSLRILSLSFNKIHVINKISNSFKNLTSLDLSYNSLDSNSLNELSQLSNLRSLDLSGNNVTSIRFSSKNPFVSLEHLFFDYNNIDDSRNLSALAELPALLSLSFTHNFLCDISFETFRASDTFRQLRSLDLSYNYLHSSKSLCSFASLPRLTSLLLYGNPCLGPSGEDPQHIYVEDLEIEFAKLARTGRRTVQVMTEAPRGPFVVSGGKRLGRRAFYAQCDLELVETLPKEGKPIYKWREEGTKVMFAELVARLSILASEDIETNLLSVCTGEVAKPDAEAEAEVDTQKLQMETGDGYTGATVFLTQLSSTHEVSDVDLST